VRLDYSFADGSPKHFSSDLCRCSGHGHHPALLVNELSGEKADILTPAYDAPSSYQTPRMGWPEELYVQVGRRSEIARIKPSHQSRSHRVIEHGGQEAALDDSGGIHEGVRGSECNFDRSILSVYREELPTERDRRCWERCPALHCIPEWALVLHIR
jgi:hypothetical protein